ncbi:MAG: DUF2846 domain-containing protein [Oleiphilaceae bacterium]|nr:DUF2846 domain-containing protein [Oleiphilaceae bacterium]
MRLHFVLVLALIVGPVVVWADTTAPYSKPFHKQGRGWYPSIYWSTGRNLGSFYFPNTNGKPFEELKEHEWDKDQNGLIYFYRPQSQWADEELEAPSYYINDQNVFNLRSGSWTVVELPAGNYDITARKGLLPLLGFEAFDDKLMIAFDLNLLGDIGLIIDPGSIHYFRHSEVSLPKRLHPDLDPEDEMATADLQMVDRELALEEMQHTRYLEHSFWTPNDSKQIQALLEGEMQDYGWFSIIWPWSNNFLFGFPLFYLPSDMYRELRDEPELTLEQKLYRLADDPEEYLAAIEELRKPKRDWLAPWRKPETGLTLNDELTLDRLERAARAGNIKPAVPEPRPPAEPGLWWFWPPPRENYEQVVTLEDRLQRLPDERRSEAMRISETLN